MNKDIKLPGLGSYMAAAIDKGDNAAALWAVVAMVVLIMASDQLVWRPLLAWADKFKIELTESAAPATSWVYELLRGAYVFTWFDERVVQPLTDALSRVALPIPGRAARVPARHKKLLWRALATLVWTLVGVWIGFQPRVARIAQPLAQIGASFPVNMTFPIMVGFFVAAHVSMNWGSILLIAMGT